MTQRLSPGMTRDAVSTTTTDVSSHGLPTRSANAALIERLAKPADVNNNFMERTLIAARVARPGWTRWTMLDTSRPRTLLRGAQFLAWFSQPSDSRHDRAKRGMVGLRPHGGMRVRFARSLTPPRLCGL